VFSDSPVEISIERNAL